MITKTTGYKASDGQVYATVEEAQRAELEAIIDPVLANNDNVHQPRAIINTLFERADDIVAILTTGPRSRPKTRKAAGTTAPKRARARAATPAQAAEGFKAVRAAVDDAHDDTPTAAGARAEAAMDAVR